jgi:hypothetical protein
MTTRAVTLAALLAVLGRPAWWILALAGFLARGGILLFLFAVVTLPSPLAISDVVEPLIRQIYFGGVTPIIVAGIGLAVGAIVALLLAGALIAASTEVVLIGDARVAAAEEGLFTRVDRRSPRWVIVRVAAARLVAHIPFAVALAFGSVQIVDVVYAELVTPTDVLTPLPVRVLRATVGPIVVMVAALVLGEITGGLSARRIAVGGGSVLGSVSRAYGDLFGRPRSSLLPALLTTLILGLELAAMLAAIDLAWTTARSQLVQIPTEPLAAGLALASFAAAWCLALLVTGLIDAWRSVAMTFEEERVAAVAEARAAQLEAAASGTYGASAHRRPGDWSAHNPGGSL